MESEDNSTVTYVVIGLIIFLFVIFSGNSSSSSSYESSYDDSTDENIIDMYDAKSDYWGEIKEYIDGSYTAEACSENSGNCYDLDIDTSDGYTEAIYFPNGGYVNISAEIDSDGKASDSDDDGDYWEITLSDSDMDDAVEQWASDNEYVLE